MREPNLKSQTILMTYEYNQLQSNGFEWATSSPCETIAHIFKGRIGLIKDASLVHPVTATFKVYENVSLTLCVYGNGCGNLLKAASCTYNSNNLIKSLFCGARISYANHMNRSPSECDKWDARCGCLWAISFKYAYNKRQSICDTLVIMHCSARTFYTQS